MTKLSIPLAERLRPRNLEDLVGQSHLLGEGKPLTLAISAGQPQSCIFWGPPGVGKTTLARLLAEAFDCHFIALSAVMSGIKDIRDAVQRAESWRSDGLPGITKRTVLFVDEVHRFNKAQQDAFLPHVESGLLTFIGATTENPSFEVNNALLSRARVYVLKALNTAELEQIFQRAQRSGINVDLSAEAAAWLLQYADGDARRLLNALEMAALGSKAKGPLDLAVLQELLGRKGRRFDAAGEHFYDAISALHKSVRGSDPDAALYWFVRMLDGGTDPQYIARRLIRIASEDIGLADPRALTLALEAAQAFERLGSPEGELALAQCVVYLAIAAKSNAVYTAYKKARALVADEPSRPVPLHLRNAATSLMRELGYGANYRYAHNETDAYAAGESYWPEDLAAQSFYQPTERGLELKIRDKLAFLRKKDADLTTN